MLEVFEIPDHFNANKYAMSNLDQTLTEDFVKKLHYYLTENTINFTKGTPLGEYIKFDMAVSETMFGDHKRNIAQMSKLLEST
ncbi:hypothetical protein JSO54_02720 [Riemerella anatipestifer]|uniref:hypothetical protein n=1 Tax=Riemerella anatipestifer TaxID=34085 RepID=UPI0013751112|nr:hypothetical protein [Riemerella anatipestifer]MDY3521496.1 hypothetical protein [Riemerella anatipestifer]MDY3533628.1 hypothetical protein [Riemerella anatipestifer]MDY3536033.1 hypothetical protein [Riemerella anatipestifer]